MHVYPTTHRFGGLEWGRGSKKTKLVAISSHTNTLLELFYRGNTAFGATWVGLRAHSPVAKLQNVFRYYGHFSKWSENLRDYFLGGIDDFKRVYFYPAETETACRHVRVDDAQLERERQRE